MPKYVTGLFTQNHLDHAKWNRERLATASLKSKQQEQEQNKQLDVIIDKSFPINKESRK